MDIKTKYGWQELYAIALLETDWSKMEEKIRVAEDGIRGRLHEFSVNHGGTVSFAESASRRVFWEVHHFDIPSEIRITDNRRGLKFLLRSYLRHLQLKATPVR